MITLPTDFWMGKDCLRLGMPWLTPGSIEWLEGALRPDMRVIEFGGGGSTMFFARRCLSVASFETDPDWQRRTWRALKELGADNVFQAPISAPDWRALHPQWREALSCAAQDYDVADVDSVSDREEICRWLSEFQLLRPRAMVILDNYGRYDADKYFPGWDIKCFDDPHWAGNGTKIYTRGAW